MNNVTGSGLGLGAVAVNSTGTLGGTGTFSGAMTANAGGKVSPGTSFDTAATRIESLGSGSITLDGATLEFEVNLDDATIDNNDADLLFGGTGSTLTLLNNPILLLSDLGVGAAVAPGEKITLISYNGTWNGGTFDGLADGATFNLLNNEWQIDYNDSTAGLNFNSDAIASGTAFVTLTAPVPEPASLSLVALGGFAALRRRRR